MKTNLARINTKDLATLSERVIAISQKPAFTLVDGHPLYLKFLNSYAGYEKVYAKKAFSGLGKDVANADNLRDIPFRAMRDILAALRQVDGLSSQKVAEALYAIILEFGADMAGYSYSSQNAQMKKLIEKLDLPENQALLETVSLVEVYEIMKANHQLFLQAFGTQAEVNADLHLQQSASALRSTLETDLRAYLNYVDIMSGFDSKWVSLKAELNEAVKSAANSSMASKEKTPAEPVK